MNGPEHYAEAERLLGGDAMDQQAALTHATLAVAAAVASLPDAILATWNGNWIADVPPGWKNVMA